ncbi:hypothetical protein FRAHR75_380001 [Frankia sp. Hr75.2]|nr:hypothetical protein FRAHR75_380001 [Frankia sp. Hr75.2]
MTENSGGQLSRTTVVDISVEDREDHANRVRSAVSSLRNVYHSSAGHQAGTGNGRASRPAAHLNRRERGMPAA